MSWCGENRPQIGRAFFFSGFALQDTLKLHSGFTRLYFCTVSTLQHSHTTYFDIAFNGNKPEQISKLYSTRRRTFHARHTQTHTDPNVATDTGEVAIARPNVQQQHRDACARTRRKCGGVSPAACASHARVYLCVCMCVYASVWCT